MRSNCSTACEEGKSKSVFKAFLISHMKTCPASAAHQSISEMQVSAQGRQQTAPLPPPPTEGNSHTRTVLVGPMGCPRKDCAGTACSLFFPSCSQPLCPPKSIWGRWGRHLLLNFWVLFHNNLNLFTLPSSSVTK